MSRFKCFFLGLVVSCGARGIAGMWEEPSPVQVMPGFLSSWEVGHLTELFGSLGLLKHDTGVHVPRVYLSPDLQLSHTEIHSSGRGWWSPSSRDDPVLRAVEERVARWTGVPMHKEEELMHIIRVHSPGPRMAGELLTELHLDSNQGSQLGTDTVIIYLRNMPESTTVVFPCLLPQGASSAAWRARLTQCDELAHLGNPDSLLHSLPGADNIDGTLSLGLEALASRICRGEDVGLRVRPERSWAVRIVNLLPSHGGSEERVRPNTRLWHVTCLAGTGEVRAPLDRLLLVKRKNMPPEARHADQAWLARPPWSLQPQRFVWRLPERGFKSVTVRRDFDKLPPIMGRSWALLLLPLECEAECSALQERWSNLAALVGDVWNFGCAEMEGDVAGLGSRRAPLALFLHRPGSGKEVHARGGVGACDLDLLLELALLPMPDESLVLGECEEAGDMAGGEAPRFATGPGADADSGRLQTFPGLWAIQPTGGGGRVRALEDIQAGTLLLQVPRDHWLLPRDVGPSGQLLFERGTTVDPSAPLPLPQLAAALLEASARGSELAADLLLDCSPILDVNFGNLAPWWSRLLHALAEARAAFSAFAQEVGRAVGSSLEAIACAWAAAGAHAVRWGGTWTLIPYFAPNAWEPGDAPASATLDSSDDTRLRIRSSARVARGAAIAAGGLELRIDGATCEESFLRSQSVPVLGDGIAFNLHTAWPGDLDSGLQRQWAALDCGSPLAIDEDQLPPLLKLCWRLVALARLDSSGELAPSSLAALTDWGDALASSSLPEVNQWLREHVSEWQSTELRAREELLSDLEAQQAAFQELARSRTAFDILPAHLARALLRCSEHNSRRLMRLAAIERTALLAARGWQLAWAVLSVGDQASADGFTEDGVARAAFRGTAIQALPQDCCVLQFCARPLWQAALALSQAQVQVLGDCAPEVREASTALSHLWLELDCQSGERCRPKWAEARSQGRRDCPFALAAGLWVNGFLQEDAEAAKIRWFHALALWEQALGRSAEVVLEALLPKAHESLAAGPFDSFVKAAPPEARRWPVNRQRDSIREFEHRLLFLGCESRAVGEEPLDWFLRDYVGPGRGAWLGDGVWVEVGTLESSSLQLLVSRYRDLGGAGLVHSLGPADPGGGGRKVPHVDGAALVLGDAEWALPRFVQHLPEASNVTLLHVACSAYSCTRAALDCLNQHLAFGAFVVFSALYGFLGYREQQLQALFDYLIESGREVETLACSRLKALHSLGSSPQSVIVQIF